MSGKRKMILYVQTSGIDTPERLYSPFVLATMLLPRLSRRYPVER